MADRGIKETAESVLRELPGVVGAFVQPDTFGHPREIHLLIKPGPRPREFALHVKSVLESRLRIPIDQRVISIAQLGEEKPPADEETQAAAAEASEPDGLKAEPASTRFRLIGIESEISGAHVTVRIRLADGEQVVLGEAREVEPGDGRVRAAALAALDALNRITGQAGRFGLDFATEVEAAGKPFVIASIVATSSRLGRRSIGLNGAQRVEQDAETAAALAVLKATNRLLAFLLSGVTRRGRAAREWGT